MFVVGEIYELTKGHCGVGGPGTQVRITQMDSANHPYFTALDGGGSCSGHEDILQLVKGDTPMNTTNPVEALRAKAQGLDATTKTLRAAKLEAKDGTMTDDGRTVLEDRLWATHRAAIAQDLDEPANAETTEDKY